MRLSDRLVADCMKAHVTMPTFMVILLKLTDRGVDLNKEVEDEEYDTLLTHIGGIPIE